MIYNDPFLRKKVEVTPHLYPTFDMYMLYEDTSSYSDQVREFIISTDSTGLLTVSCTIGYSPNNALESYIDDTTYRPDVMIRFTHDFNAASDTRGLSAEIMATVPADGEYHGSAMNWKYIADPGTYSLT